MALNIAVCMKVAPDPDKYNLIKLDPVTKTLMRAGIDSVISTTDLHAIELALQLKKKFGGKVTVINMGPPSNEKQLREALGYGCDEAVLLSDRKLGGADALATSYTLFKGLEKSGSFDLVLLGNISDDGSTAHVLSQLGEWLGVPHLTHVVSFDMADESSASAGMEIDGGLYLYNISLPAVVGVTKRLNTVRHPNVRDIFMAKKKPLTVLTAEDLPELDESRIGLAGSPTQAVGYIDADFHRDCVEITGKSEEQADEQGNRYLFRLQRKAGVYSRGYGGGRRLRPKAQKQRLRQGDFHMQRKAGGA